MAQGPMEMLEAEHRVIQRVVGAMVRLEAALEQGGEPKVEMLRATVEFMRQYADRCHHGKEEAYLFTLLERKGVPIGGCPLGGLTHEHEKGRALVTALAEATEAYQRDGVAAREAVKQSLHALAALYPAHIWKEDYLLFPMANKLLSAEEQRNLRGQFELVEAELGREAYDRFERFAEALETAAVPA
jgi:hemerythrin-like domain-containing protein